MTPKQVQTELSAHASRAQSSHVIVQFESPVTPEMKVKLQAAGISLGDYLGDNAFFASLSQARFNTGALAAVPALTRVAAIQQSHKLHPDLLFNRIFDWMVVGASIEALGEGEPSTGDGEHPPVDHMVGVYIKFHKDVTLDPDAIQVVQQFGAAVRSQLKPINSLVIELPYSQIKPLADHDSVAWIEPPLPRFSEVNAENRVRTGANTVQAAPYGLNGAGVTVMVYDGGRVRTTHQDFTGRAQVGAGELACTGISDHSTHVAGTIGGAGVADVNEKGMAPAVDIISYGYNQGGGCSLSSGFLYTDPGDLAGDYGEAINTYGADIANNSIGTNTAPNGFPCSWEGDYGLCSSLIDAVVRGAVSPGGAPFRVVWANGNERQVSTCGTTYHTTAPPACAKNHITVGALNSNDDSVTSFTSWGPSDDGRMKPDISAPGCEVGGDGGVRSCGSASDTAYAVKCGTSMASPTVCGLSALLLQDFRAQFPARPDFRNSTLKILLAHTAVDLFNPGPDNQTGYGSVRIQPCVDFMRSDNFLENSVDQGGVYNVLVVVNPGAPELKVTLAWDDPESGAVVIGTLVNDLDLVVLDASNTQYFPWTLDVNNPGNPAVRTQKNSLDNIEQVYVANPTPGVYRVEVRGFNVPQGPQPFSLCASPLLVNCSEQGTASLDRAVYPCTSPATLTVVDCDLNTDDMVVETVNVSITSTSEPTGETVTLTETGAQTALFQGTINLSPTNSSGVLQVAHGDTVTMTYLDADDGMGGMNVTVTAMAPVDCVAPVISSVATSNLGPHTATVTFTTDESAKGTVRYGTSCGSLTGSVEEAAFGTSHSLVINGLLDDTQYFFAVDAIDPATNASTDDNGGACYTFTTPEIPDSFTEEFAAADFDLDNVSLQFTPNASIDFYAMCSSPITVLPTDPAGGTVLTLADNANANVTLGGGAQVSLYGVNYSGFFVGSNGYITFTAGDTDSTPTVLDHFDTPRISALFANLNPAAGGTVSWKQLADRAVVTWENVPQATTTNTNTLQVEMYFDGRLRISLLTVDLTAGITGLSAGGGIPPDFTEMNLSAAATCGPQPPAAASRSVETPISIPLDITLIAGDDGIPGPLSYIITTLPAFPLEDLGNNHTIVPGDLPYTLSGGTQVRYHSGGTPTTDSFQFKVNDGGTPPSGGDSNTATVAITVHPVLSLPFFDDFPATTFDPQKWYLVDTATIDGLGLAEPSEPNSAHFDGDPNGGDELRTHLINLSGETAVRLKYWYEIRGGGESPDAGEDLIVEFLNNVGSWELINQHLGTGADMTTYQQVNVLLPPQAFHAGFRLRFRNSATSGAFDDWFVDDVSIAVANAPDAFNSSVTAPFNGFLDITLSALDPNGDTLSYIILSLPANGTLKDPGAGLADILTVPYTLAGNGNVVRYVPNIGFGGNNQFSFRVNDGVFDSNNATVSILVEPVLTLPFFDDFPTTTFDSAKWGLVQNATIDGLGIAEPSEPNSARLNGNPTANGDEIRTFAFDLSSVGLVRLTYYFECRGGGESPDTGDDLIVEYLNNVGTWVELQRHLGTLPDMTTYQQATILLPAGAMHSSFRLRFRCIATAGAFDDWFVDNVSLDFANAPTAQNTAAATAINTMAPIVLPATDPNGDTMTWVILSLPTHGLLKDPNGAIINAVPYSLLTNGNTVLYKPTFNYQGTDLFTFKATDGTYDSNIANVDVTIGGPQVIHSFPLDTDPGWSADPGPGGTGPNAGGWALGTPTNTESCGADRLDPSSGFTGSNVYGYNLAGCYTSTLTPTRYLTTNALDCSNATAVQLRFRRWLGVESASFDHVYVDVSTNGSTWTNVWQNPATTINEQAWTLQTYNVAAADNQATVYFRWGMGTTDGSVIYHSWNIDDIEVIGLVPQSCGAVTLGDVNGDTKVDGLDIAGMVKVLVDPFAANAAEQCAADINQDNALDLVDASALATLLLSLP